jgi:hypothetical protein
MVPRCGSTRCSIQIQMATIKKMTAAPKNIGVHGIPLMNDQSATLDSIPFEVLRVVNSLQDGSALIEDHDVLCTAETRIHLGVNSLFPLTLLRFS